MTIALALRSTTPVNRAAADESPDKAPAPAPRRPETQPGPAETRLKLLIETVPASIIVASPDGAVVAANREALTMLGIARLEDLLGARLEGCVAPEDRERFQTFLAQVCEGEPATLEYELVDPNGITRAVETRAVPLSRAGITPAAFLSVTWDVSERKRAAAGTQNQAHARCELLDAQLHAQRDAYEVALRDAKAAHDEILLERASERKALGEMVRDARSRLQTRLAEAEEHHEQLTAAWDGEREALQERLRVADEKQATTSAHALTDQNQRQLAALQALEAQHQAALSGQAAEHQRLEAAIGEMRTRLVDLELERTAERDHYASTLRDERARCRVWLEERDQWRIRLSDLLKALPSSSGEQCLDQPAAPGPGSTATDGPVSEAEPAGDSRWGF